MNAKGNVAGLMPHPERASETILGSEDGIGILRSLVESAARARAGVPAGVGAR
jgi:phosphoribosylformylglycinamidine synthase